MHAQVAFHVPKLNLCNQNTCAHRARTIWRAHLTDCHLWPPLAPVDSLSLCTVPVPGDEPWVRPLHCLGSRPWANVHPPALTACLISFIPIPVSAARLANWLAVRRNTTASRQVAELRSCGGGKCASSRLVPSAPMYDKHSTPLTASRDEAFVDGVLPV